MLCSVTCQCDVFFSHSCFKPFDIDVHIRCISTFIIPKVILCFDSLSLSNFDIILKHLSHKHCVYRREFSDNARHQVMPSYKPMLSKVCASAHAHDGLLLSCRKPVKTAYGKCELCSKAVVRYFTCCSVQGVCSISGTERCFYQLLWW